MTGRQVNGQMNGQTNGRRTLHRHPRAGKAWAGRMGQSVTGRVIRCPATWPARLPATGLLAGLLVLLPGLPLPGLPLPSLMLHGVPPGTAQAAQYRVAGEEAAIAAVVSMREITRIALRGDRITGVVARPRGFTVEHDAESGDVFLVPGAGGLPDAPVNMFVSSEGGRTWQLLLTPRDVPAEQIVLIGPRAPDPRSMRAPRREALARLMRAMITGALPEDHARRAPVPADLDYLPPPAPRTPLGTMAAEIEITEVWQGARFRGLDIHIPGGITGEISGEISGGISGSMPAGADRLSLAAGLAPLAAAAWLSEDGKRAIIIIEAGEDDV